MWSQLSEQTTHNASGSLVPGRQRHSLIAICVAPEVFVAHCPLGVQAKLQKAQQQREYAKAFHADVLKKLAAEGVAQQVGAPCCLCCHSCSWWWWW